MEGRRHLLKGLLLESVSGKPNSARRAQMVTLPAMPLSLF